MAINTSYAVGTVWILRPDRSKVKGLAARVYKYGTKVDDYCSRGWIINTIGLDGAEDLERSEET